MRYRINQFLSQAGVCARRKSNLMIKEGRVFINGKHAQIGDVVETTDCVSVDGSPVRLRHEKIYFLYYKPRGVVTSMNKNAHNNLVHHIQTPIPVFPVGRLDKLSEGLILLTNDGALSHALSNPNNHHEKTYRVTVDKEINADFITALRKGVNILNTRTRPCIVETIDCVTFDITLTQGLNRQIRRMCQVHNYRVLRLIRTKIMHLEPQLNVGEIRPLTDAEVLILHTRLKTKDTTDEKQTK